MRASYFITTLGCPKNQADSREMERSLRRQGLVPAVDAISSDYHLINSCAFIESARVETIQTVLDAARVKADSKATQKLILVGCFTERYQEVLENELPEVDLSFGTGRYHEAGEILARRFSVGDAWSAERTPGAADLMRVPAPGAGLPYAPVKISDGCGRSCAFCAIPSFRGAFRDIPRQRIIEECRELTAAGVREICLVSQDTNNYGSNVNALLDLLEELHGVPDLRWIRPLYLYPDPRTEQLLRGMAARGFDRVVPYLESPVQHVSARVLRNMRRYGDAAKFRDLFALARDLFPGLEVRTSFLVGFPGEEPEDVDELLRFLDEARPEKLALFSYSLEENTPGFGLGDPVDEAEKAERVNLLRSRHLEILREYHAARVGRTYACMIDGVEGDQVLARRAQDAPEIDEAVFLDRAAFGAQVPAPGEILDVEITGFYEYDMTGKVPARSAR